MPWLQTLILLCGKEMISTECGDETNGRLYRKNFCMVTFNHIMRLAKRGAGNCLAFVLVFTPTYTQGRRVGSVHA
jgi:hypothetical protein